MISITRETPEQEEIAILLRQSDRFSAALYPPESRHQVSAEVLAALNARFFVARVDGRAVGCGALLLDSEGSGEIKRMFVEPASRGHGVGRAILAEIENAARNEGVALLRLETGIGNREGLELYRRCGYSERGPFGSYRRDAFSVFMEKTI